MNEKSSGSRSRKQKLTVVGSRCADHVTPLYPQKLALTSPTGGGRSVGIVRVRTKATEFSFNCISSKVAAELTHMAVVIKNTFIFGPSFISRPNILDLFGHFSISNTEQPDIYNFFVTIVTPTFRSPSLIGL